MRCIWSRKKCSTWNMKIASGLTSRSFFRRKMSSSSPKLTTKAEERQVFSFKRQVIRNPSPKLRLKSSPLYSDFLIIFIFPIKLKLSPRFFSVRQLKIDLSRTYSTGIVNIFNNSTVLLYIIINMLSNLLKHSSEGQKNPNPKHSVFE